MNLTNPDSIQHQCLLHSCGLIDLLLYSGIHFFPETRNAAHQCRTNFLNGCLYIRRTEIDTDLYPFMDTEIAPSLFKYMRQWKEVHRNILIRHRGQAVVMSAKLFQITGMMKHDSFRFTCRSGRIKNISQIVIRGTSRTLFHHIIVRKSFSHRHKLIKIDGRHITGVFYDRTVKDNQLLQ